ncbi:MAG TPA: HEAT repeat domain-containing protein [Kofleriaceae bacterium]|jgi:HEAT repeat protein|nr:HEAT repeat domain-containing protein [Kofleriaceae bacterium]
MFSSSLHERIVQRLTRDAFSPQLEVKERALDRLGALDGAVELLIAGLRDPDPEIRSTAAVNLGRIRRLEAWPPLVWAARNESSEDALCRVVGALAAYHDPTIAEVLSELLAARERDYRVRMEVVVQLWKYEPRAARAQLVDVVLSDDNEIVRVHAADSLEFLNNVYPIDPDRRQLWLRLVEDDASGVVDSAVKALQSDETAPVGNVLAEISRRLQHPAADERAFALHRLSMLGPPSSASLAIPLLDDADQGVRVSGCACLGEIRDPTAIPALLAVLSSHSGPRVRVAALLALENYYATEIGEALLNMLDTGAVNSNALSVLCRQLWKYPSNRTVELLQRVLASSIQLPHRPVVEDTLRFLMCLDTAEPQATPT